MRNNILFIPLGEEEEAIFMTNFAIEFAKFNRNNNIIIRYHPILRKKFLNYAKFELDNFKISSQSLSEDCRFCKWAVFSSSTAVFEGAQEGCLPIRLSYGLIPEISNPMWQINSKLIPNISNYCQLDELIKKTNLLDQSEFKNKIENINKSILDIRCKFNNEVLLNCLNNLNN